MPDGITEEAGGSILTDPVAPPAPAPAPAPAAAPAAAPAEVVTKPVQVEKATEVDWAKSLPEGFEGLENLSKFKSLEDLAKSYIHAETLIGREKIPMPQTDEEIAEVLERLGAPKLATEYGFELPKDVDPKYKDLFEADLKWFVETALANKLTKKQAQGIFKSYSEMQQGNKEKLDQIRASAKSEAMTMLQREYGDKTQEVIHQASRVLNQFGDESLKNLLDESGLGNHTGLVRFLNKIAPLIAEETSVDRAPAQTLAELDTEMNEAFNDPAYLDKSKAGHKQAVEKVKKLMKLRYPD